ncbi:MAG: hypothetical protein WCR52_07190 [Bacteroidota bacterium]
MMNGLYDYDDIEDYLEDRMSESDRIAFEQALKTDQDLIKRVNVVRAEAIVQRMMRDEYIMGQFEAWDKEAAEKKTDFSSPGQDGVDTASAYKKRLIPIAIGLLFLVGIAAFYFSQRQTAPIAPVNQSVQPVKPDTASRLPNHAKSPTDSSLIASQNAPLKNKGVPKSNPDNAVAFYDALAKETYREGNLGGTLLGGGNENSISDPYDKALQMYKDKKYSAALPLLMHPTKEQESDYFYLRGYIYYHLGQYRKAEQDFHAFRGMKYSNHKIDAEWREVFCMVRQLPGARKRLDAALEEITADQEHNYYKEAVALKEALKGK